MVFAPAWTAALDLRRPDLPRSNSGGSGEGEVQGDGVRLGRSEEIDVNCILKSKMASWVPAILR